MQAVKLFCDDQPRLTVCQIVDELHSLPDMHVTLSYAQAYVSVVIAHLSA